MNDLEPEGMPAYGPPWSRIPSFYEMVEEVNIDPDDFIEYVKDLDSIEEMMEHFHLSRESIESLLDYFYRYGINSVEGTT